MVSLFLTLTKTGVLKQTARPVIYSVQAASVAYVVESLELVMKMTGQMKKN